MSPLSISRCQSAATPALCRGSVVRMKSSWLKFMAAARSRKRCET